MVSQGAKMRSRSALAAVLSAFVTTACLQIQVSPPPPSKPEKTPQRIQAASEPELVPTDVTGVLHAQLDVPDVYYVEPAERWNGYWFPLPQTQVPKELAAFVPTVEQREERRLTRDEELRALEEELRRIEEEEAAERAAKEGVEQPDP